MQLRCFAWCCGPVRTLCFALPNSPERRYHCLNSIIDKGQVMAKPASVLSESQSADAMLRARASRVVPGGMWGHLNATRLPEGYPQFFASGDGCRVRDVDGREYIDFMCSWGPVLLGHRHPEVQAAADAQAALGDCFNGPGEGMVGLAEDFVR